MPKLTDSVITFSYQPSTWTKDSVTITITDTQAESHNNGLHLEYCKGSYTGAWTDVPQNKQVTATQNETIYVRLSDGQNSGTTYATGNITNIDKTAPTITGITANTPTSSSITVTLNASDQDSGIKKISWQYQEGDNSAWNTFEEQKNGTPSDSRGTGDKSSSFTHKFESLNEGTKYTFKATVTDAALNQNTTSQEATATTQTTGITPTKENYGEYVDYPVDIDNIQSTYDWRVFYVGQEEDGQAKDRIFLIAADYVAHTCSALSTAITASGMTNYHNTNDSYETYYWNSPPDYHCNDGHNTANQGKAQCSFPELFMPENQYCDRTHRYFCSDHTSYANSKCASRLQCTGDWKTFAKEEYADYAIGGPTLNMWVESWNTKHGSERELYANGPSNGYGYYVGTSTSTKEYSQDLSSYAGYNDTLYFLHQTYQNDLGNDKADEYCYGHWLASPAANGNDLCLMFVYCGGDVSRNNYSNYGYGVRPVA